MTSSPIQVSDYIMFYKTEEGIHKKNKKKLTKRQILKRFNFKITKYTDSDMLKLLKKSIVEIRRSSKQNPFEGIGVIFDSNLIIHDITFLPPRPKNFDILCLESVVKKYDTQKSEETIYWHNTKIIHSGNFFINAKSINKFIEIIDKSKSITEFYENINKLNIYTITQHQLSEKSESYVHDPMIKNRKLTAQDKNDHKHKINDEYFNKIQDLHINELTSQLVLHNKSIPQTSLPKLTLVCPLTNADLTFHTILTFLNLDYPSYLMELIIVDSHSSEKKIKLPDDERLRFISLAPKTDKGEFNVSIGQQLNIGAKHAENDIIVHFLDTNNYNTKTFKQHIIQFLLCKKDCMMSNKTGIYRENKSMELNVPDIANMIYMKTFYEIHSFEENINCSLNGSIYRFIHNRLNLIEFVPFILWSFNFNKNLDEINTIDIPFSLLNCVDSKIKESFLLL